MFAVGLVPAGRLSNIPGVPVDPWALPLEQSSVNSTEWPVGDWFLGIKHNIHSEPQSKTIRRYFSFHHIPSLFPKHL